MTGGLKHNPRGIQYTAWWEDWNFSCRPRGTPQLLTVLWQYSVSYVCLRKMKLLRPNFSRMALLFKQLKLLCNYLTMRLLTNSLLRPFDLQGVRIWLLSLTDFFKSGRCDEKLQRIRTITVDDWRWPSLNTFRMWILQDLTRSSTTQFWRRAEVTFNTARNFKITAI